MSEAVASTTYKIQCSWTDIIGWSRTAAAGWPLSASNQPSLRVSVNPLDMHASLPPCTDVVLCGSGACSAAASLARLWSKSISKARNSGGATSVLRTLIGFLPCGRHTIITLSASMNCSPRSHSKVARLSLLRM